ncbi:histidine phosphatase family protein [Pedobacter rhizosphaerae]|uniref:Probable phosphoglycerate mutase n=1 Tax=Pedobacter rhizosphaerae TaxID=390241 RepID=A0A1H9M789_9SPHI|nr:histidine phosphatase family protein [Pedobacter rhizosphaerae]SER19566.1 probable phosphoglycerate mutase [Pedobacter rhizosphaerae]
MKQIYIIRHGETELNRQGIVQGRGINSDLNDTGRAQAEAFYQKYKDIPFDKIYTSSLKRTWQTVQKFIDSKLPWEQLTGLDELAWGVWEGKANTEDSRDAFRLMLETWQQGDYTAHFDGGESVQDVYDRLKEPMQILMSRPEEETILLCMHGRAMRVFLCLLLNKPLSEMTEFPHQNTVLYKVGFENGKFSMLEFNNASHLEGLVINND